MLSQTQRILDKIDYFFYSISKIALLIMMFLVTFDSIGRYILDTPIPWAYKLTESYLMVILVFLSISYVQKLDGHIKVDIFVRKIPDTIKRALNILSLFLSFLFMLFVSYFSILKTVDAWEKNYTEIGVLELPIWLSLIWVAIGTILFSFRLLLSIFKAFFSYKNEEKLQS